MAKNTSARNVKVTLVKSPFGQIHRHRATVRGLGLRRMNQTVVLADTPEIPAGAQWSTFLRNHDELTLEMVSTE